MLRDTSTSIKGFTLIEILVVLVIIGLIAGVALPRLMDISQRFEAATQKKRLLSEVGLLGYRAYTTGRPLTLTSLPSPQPTTDPIEMPPGWRIEVAAPIKYAFTGICNGGSLTVISPATAPAEWQLAPPLCKPVAKP